MSKKNTTYSSHSKGGFNYLLIPIAIVLGIIPHIVYLKQFKTGLENYDFFSNTPESIDIFLYYKAAAFIGLSAVIAFILAYKLIAARREISFSKLFFPLALYGLLALLSAIFSDYAAFSFSGSYNQFESVWVLLGYCLITYYTAQFVNSEKDLRFLLNVLLISTIVMLLLGLSQALKVDFYRTKLGSSLIAPSVYLQDGGLSFTFELGRVYLSLYNPNYVGSYVSLLSPIFIMLIFTTVNKWMKALYAVMYAALIVTLVGSQSRAGFIGVIASLVLLAVIFNKLLIKHWIPAVSVVALIAVIFIVMNASSSGALLKKITSAFDIQKKTPNISAIYTNDAEVTVSYKGNDLKVYFNFNPEDSTFTISPLDADNKYVAAASNENGSLTITDERFAGITVSPAIFPDDTVGFELIIDGKRWHFAQHNGTYHYFTNFGKWIKLEQSESFEPLSGYAGFASGRGYLWEKTIPLLKDNILLGSGPDTFIFEFPNWDFVSAYNSGYENMIITKPHNMYLQIGVQTGVVSLIAFLAFYAMYFFSSLVLYMKTEKNSLSVFTGIGILSGSFGYMVVGIINDSIITVAPLFWCLIGLGLAINTIIRSQQQSTLNTMPKTAK